MLDSTPSPVRMQRSHGVAAVALARDAGGARLTHLRQSGSAKALLPRVTGLPEVVFLNTSGGLTSGDTLNLSLTAGPGLRAVATTQTAERAYRADHGPARVEVVHEVGAGGWLDWLPQETILFEGSDLQRGTTIRLGAEAGCVMVETVVLGRAAMGETPRRLHLTDRRRIERSGVPVLIEPLRLTPDVLAAAGNPALLGGARAFATLVLCAPGAEAALEAVRAVPGRDGVEAAASGFDGKLVVRLLARDLWPLRQHLLPLMTVLRRGAPPPRVWQI